MTLVDKDEDCDKLLLADIACDVDAVKDACVETVPIGVVLLDFVGEAVTTLFDASCERESEKDDVTSREPLFNDIEALRLGLGS